MGRATTENFYITARETSSVRRQCWRIVWRRDGRRTSRRRRRCGRRVTVVVRGGTAAHRRVPTTTTTMTTPTTTTTTTAMVCQYVRAIRIRITRVVSVLIS